MLKARLQEIEIYRKTDKGTVQYLFEAFAYSDRDFQIRSIKKSTPKFPDADRDEDFIVEMIDEDKVSGGVMDEFIRTLFKDE